MPYTVDTEIDLTPQTTSRYVISSQHRQTGRPHKSVWTITYGDEVNCFLNSRLDNWLADSHYWGLKLSGNSIEVLGMSPNQDELKIAKFVDGNNRDIWHGYPADYLKRPQDIPDVTILRTWKECGFINKASLTKIRRGMPCNL